MVYGISIILFIICLSCVFRKYFYFFVFFFFLVFFFNFFFLFFFFFYFFFLNECKFSAPPIGSFTIYGVQHEPSKVVLQNSATSFTYNSTSQVSLLFLLLFSFCFIFTFFNYFFYFLYIMYINFNKF